MKKRLLSLLVLLLAVVTGAVAQTPPGYADRFPPMPPLSVSFDEALFAHSHQNRLTPSAGIQKKDTAIIQSIMFRQHEKQKIQFHINYNMRPDYTKVEDNFVNIRDRIVRKRRKDEGRPIAPMIPTMMR